MNRRQFFQTSVKAAATGAAVFLPLNTTPAASSRTPSSAGNAAGAPAILASCTAEDQRRRLQNIAVAEKGVRACLRKHLVTNYLPAQCAYTLGEYPCRKPWNPGGYDERELDRLKDHGIQLIQLFDEWNDSLRLFGGDKFTAVNPAGFRRFIQMVHRRGMKVITYASPCFLQRTDPDFRPEWSRECDYLELGYWNIARCSPASPGWRAFLLPRILRILDTYELDGIYLDGGYVQNYHNIRRPPTKDEVAAFNETAEHDAAFSDLLALVYAEVKRRGGILKLHVDGADQPRTAGMKVYDYLWVGEGVNNADTMREAVRNYPPYVVPCIDMNYAKIGNADDPYLHAIPYLQFPLLQAGRPFTGERGMIPGVKYASDQDWWMQRCRQAWQYYQAHPDGPYTYGSWDAVPEHPETRPTHARWLKQYQPLAEAGTWAYLEITDSNLLTQPLPANAVASAFANREFYLVLANYGSQAAEIVTADAYVTTDNSGVPAAKQWNLPPRSLKILRRSA